MHELGVTQAVLKIALDTLEQAGLSRVTRVTLTVGELRGFEQDWVQRYFTSAARGTAAEGAEISLVTIASKFHCDDCTQDFHIDVRDDGVPRCPHCRGRKYRLVSGQELMINGIEAS